jgi:hypothetical protein
MFDPTWPTDLALASLRWISAQRYGRPESGYGNAAG